MNTMNLEATTTTTEVVLETQVVTNSVGASGQEMLFGFTSLAILALAIIVLAWVIWIVWSRSQD